MNSIRSMPRMVVVRRCHPISVGKRSFSTAEVVVSLVRRDWHYGVKGNKLTQPVLNELLLYRASSAVSHDLEKGSHLAPAEAVGQLRQRVLGVGLLGGCQATHSRLGDLIDCDHVVRKVGEGLGPDRLIERVRVGKVGVGSTAW